MHFIGEITLNLSFVLYFFFYLPQLIANFRHNKCTDLSLGFHALLLISATADLYYAFGRIDQWQYRVVSLMMFYCLLVQHVHLMVEIESFRYGRLKLWALSLIVVLMLCVLFWVMQTPSAHGRLFVLMGWVERIGYWLYSVPQMIKNHQNKRADCLSPLFISIAIVTALCDSVSAWCLSWGPSSLYGAPVAVMLHLILFRQWAMLRPDKSGMRHRGWQGA